MVLEVPALATGAFSTLQADAKSKAGDLWSDHRGGLGCRVSHDRWLQVLVAPVEVQRRSSLLPVRYAGFVGDRFYTTNGTTMGLRTVTNQWN